MRPLLLVLFSFYSLFFSLSICGHIYSFSSSLLFCYLSFSDGCDLGEYGVSPGSCTKCKSGQYSDARGSASCTLCAADTYNSESGASSRGACLKCTVEHAPHTTTSTMIGVANATTGCICAGRITILETTNEKLGYYTVPNIQYNEEMKKKSVESRTICRQCSPGADCENDGTNLQIISAQPGYWRPRFDAVEFLSCQDAYQGENANLFARNRCCPVNKSTNESICKEFTLGADNRNQQCSTGYIGVLCRACDTSTHVVMGDSCAPCMGGANFVAAFGSVAAVAFVTFAAHTLFLFLCTRDHDSVERAIEKGDAANAFTGQLKLLLTFLQILSSVTVAFDRVPWPENFKSK